MKDDNKTKKQLVQELAELRLQNTTLKESGSIEKYRSLVENIRDVIYELDNQGVVLYISPSIRDILGFNSTEIIGKNFIELAYKDDLSRMTEWFSELNKGIEKLYDYRVLNKSGELRWTQTKTRPVIEGGVFKGAHGILIDVTEQKQAEQALRQSEELFRSYLEYAPDGVCVIDLEGRFLYGNRKCEEIIGYRREELFGKNLLELNILPQKSLSRASQSLQASIEGKPTGPDEIEIISKGGHLIPVEINTSVIQRMSQRIVLAFVRDITDRKKVEERSKQTNVFLDSIIENIPNMIFLKDARDLRFIRFNRAGEDLLGYSRDDLIGKNDYDFFPRDEADHFTEKDREVLNGKKVIDIPEETLQTLKKGKRIMHTKKVPLLDSKGEPEFLLGISEDITETKRSGAILRQQTDAMDAAIDGMAILNEAGEYVYLNKAHARIYGYENAGELIGKSWRILYDLDDLRYFDQKIMPEFGRKGDWQGEAIGTKKDGSRFPQGLSLTAMANGGLICVVRDITDRKRAQEELKRSKTLLDSVFNSSQDLILVIDRDLRVLMSNWKSPIFAGHTEFPTNPHCFEAFIQRDTPCEPCHALGVFNTGKPVLVEYYNQYTELFNEVSAYPIFDDHNHVIMVAEQVRDITHRKLAEKKLQDTLESLRKAVGASVQVLVSAVEARDPYTSGHQIRSADLARAIATEMGLPHSKIEGIRMAASIHDIGKLSIPAEILSKPTKLTEIELSLIKEHAHKGFEMLKSVESPWPLAEIIYQHHERMDGSGYPRNLKGEEILIESRILNVADVVEAMASHRPYRPGLGIDAALNEIEKNRGILYDNTVANACLRLFREKGFKLEGT